MSDWSRSRMAVDRWVSVQLLVVAILAGVVGWDAWRPGNVDAGTAVLALCWVNNVAFAVQLHLLRRALGGYLNPVVLMSALLFLFSSGQLVLHSLGLVSADYDLFSRLSLETIRSCCRFIILGFAMYQLGVLVSLRRAGGIWRTSSMDDPACARTDKGILRAGLVLTLVGILPYALFTYQNLYVVLMAGYRAYYAPDAARLSSGIAGLGYLLFAGLVLLVVAGKRPTKQAAIAALVLIATLRLVTGDRGEGFAILLGALLLYVTFIQKMTRASWISAGAASVVLLYATPIVAAIRGSYGQGGNLIQIAGEASTSSPLVGMLSNLGGTLLPLAKVIEVVPLNQEFILGGSYLAALVLFVPSPLRVGLMGRLAYDYVYSSPSHWLMGLLGMNYGPGFTPFAEAFLNFGWWGVMAMFVLGILAARLVSPGVTASRDANLARGLGILAFLLFATAARGSFNYIPAFYFRYVLLPYWLVLLLRDKPTSEHDLASESNTVVHPAGDR